MKNVMVLNGVYLDRKVYALLTLIINPLKYRYIMLYINLYFIRPENTYVLVGSFQYGPLEPGWLLEDTEPENIWFMKLIDINIFWLKIDVTGKGIYEKMNYHFCLYLPQILLCYVLIVVQWDAHTYNMMWWCNF